VRMSFVNSWARFGRMNVTPFMDTSSAGASGKRLPPALSFSRIRFSVCRIVYHQSAGTIPGADKITSFVSRWHCPLSKENVQVSLRRQASEQGSLRLR
jgi:hypothetical protein